MARLIGIREDGLEETVRSLRQAKVQAAVTRMRERAREVGLDGLSDKDVEAEIQAARRERRS